MLIYKFKKEKLDNGKYVARPRILVTLKGPFAAIEVPALIDSGCDTTVIPEGLARVIGLNMSGEKDRLVAYREETPVIHSRVDLVFEGKQYRSSVNVSGIPILVALSGESEEDITLGINGIFDYFHITFKKDINKILMKQVTKCFK